MALAIGSVARAPNSLSIVALGTAYTVLSLFLCGRLLWAGIFTSSAGVHVTNILRSFDLRWEEIDRFEIGRWKVIQRACLIHLRDGETRFAAGIGESANLPNGAAEAMVEELNAELQREQANAVQNDPLASS